jgi:hypothetical protein
MELWRADEDVRQRQININISVPYVGIELATTEFDQPNTVCVWNLPREYYNTPRLIFFVSIKMLKKNRNFRDLIVISIVNSDLSNQR